MPRVMQNACLTAVSTHVRRATPPPRLMRTPSPENVAPHESSASPASLENSSPAPFAKVTAEIPERYAASAAVTVPVQPENETVSPAPGVPPPFHRVESPQPPEPFGFHSCVAPATTRHSNETRTATDVRHSQIASLFEVMSYPSFRCCSAFVREHAGLRLDGVVQNKFPLCDRRARRIGQRAANLRAHRPRAVEEARHLERAGLAV